MSRAVFLGTPQAATPSLRALSEVAEVVLVVTKPDRPRGRSGRPQPPPVKLEAERLGISISQPDRSSELTGLLEAATPVDLGVVVAFGMILRADTLAVPRLGFLNIHFSLLPRWRGAAPVQRAIMASDPKTGVTLLRLDEGLDTGPVLATQPTPIGELETAGELTDRLARLGAELLRETLPAYLEGRVVPSEQPEEGVTTALRIRQEEARLDLRAPAAAVLARVRALAPRPGAHGVLDGVRFKVLAARPAPGAGLSPGELDYRAGRLLCGVGDGTVELNEVQPAGKRSMSGAAWARGRQGRVGTDKEHSRLGRLG